MCFPFIVSSHLPESSSLKLFGACGKFTATASTIITGHSTKPSEPWRTSSQQHAFSFFHRPFPRYHSLLLEYWPLQAFLAHPADSNLDIETLLLQLSFEEGCAG